MTKFFVRLAVALVVFGGIGYYINSAVLWCEKNSTGTAIEAEYNLLGKQVAEKVLFLAKPWLLAEPYGHGASAAERFGEFDFRANRIHGFNSNPSYDNLTRDIMEEYANCISQVENSDFVMNPFTVFETAKKNTNFQHAMELELTLAEIRSILYKAKECESWKQLEHFKSNYRDAKKGLEGLLDKEVTRTTPPPKKQV